MTLATSQGPRRGEVRRVPYSSGVPDVGNHADEIRGKKAPALVVLAHLRWDFVWQRPQHLMTCAAREREVFYVETPFFEENIGAHLTTNVVGAVTVCQPRIPSGLSPADSQSLTALLLARFIRERGVETYDLWVYTPMELPVADFLSPRYTIYDCMDELANFLGAPPELKQRELELFERADVVFTGGTALWEAKRDQHPRVRAFPSSVDVNHFGAARGQLEDPSDQASLRRPRLGYCGVIDERLDYALIAEVARRRPDWDFVLVGPVVKINPADLPVGENLHYLGGKDYSQLPQYLSNWDVALMPFALNEATRFISPTKTPEYLAAGLPVVSTPIKDVVRPWGEQGMVRIAGDADGFEAACAGILDSRGSAADDSRRASVDDVLKGMSWRHTWQGMVSELGSLNGSHRGERWESLTQVALSTVR